MFLKGIQCWFIFELLVEKFDLNPIGDAVTQLFDNSGNFGFEFVIHDFGGVF